MPIDLEKIVQLENEEKHNKLHPKQSRREKKNYIQSLTHWVIVDIYGKQHGELCKNKGEIDSYLAMHHDELFKDGLPRIQRLICHPSITCNCSEIATFFKYSNRFIIYKCKKDHKTRISEYD